MQFVWCYCREMEKDNEIALSIASVHTYFQGTVATVVVGDYCPEADIHIPHKRIGFQQRRSNTDVIKKLQTVIDSDKVEDEFTWMMDDIHFINDVSMVQLKQRYYHEFIPEKNPTRAHMKEATEDYVRKILKVPYYDFATHLPHVVKKDRLSHVFDMLYQSPLLMVWETLYECLYQMTVPISSTPFLVRIVSPPTERVLVNSKKNSHILNHNNTGYTPVLKAWLEKNMNEQAAER